MTKRLDFHFFGEQTVNLIHLRQHPVTSSHVFDEFEKDTVFASPQAKAKRRTCYKVMLSRHASKPEGVLLNLEGYGYWPRRAPVFNLAESPPWPMGPRRSPLRFRAEILLAFQSASNKTMGVAQLVRTLEKRQLNLSNRDAQACMWRLLESSLFQHLSPAVYRLHEAVKPQMVQYLPQLAA